MPLLITGGTYAMNWFSGCFRWLQFVSNRTPSKILHLVAVLLSFPCFKASHFFFKLTYALQQRRLRLACREDFFLKFYDRRVSSDGVVDVLQSLRHIQRGLEGAEAHRSFTEHSNPR